LANYITLIFNGISEGAHIFLMAASLSVILGLLGVVNFAHGALFVWGAYTFRTVFIVSGSWPLGLLVATITGFLLGVLFEKVFISRIYGNTGAQIMITLGLQIVFTELIRVIWGPSPLVVQRPDFLASTTVLSGVFNGVVIVHYRLFLIIVGVTVAILGHLLLTKTKVGMTIRAGTQDSEMVGALGINIRRYFTLVFASGGALAGLGGALFAPLNGTLIPELGNGQQLLAFIVVIVGGMGSFLGSAIGSLFIGVMVALIGWTFPDISLVAPVALMALVLIFRPQGLFGLAVKK
jgi:branched-chain amino acid transport system permease protein